MPFGGQESLYEPANDRVQATRAVSEDSAPPCFLCAPRPELLVNEGSFATVIAGLGPVLQNYCLIASKPHVKSLADFILQCPEGIDELVRYRTILERHLGPILLTEHGRVPLCRDDLDQHEQHCHHAHALLFPTARSITQTAASFYRVSKNFTRMEDALRFAASAENYLLISPSLESFIVLTDSLGAPRQLTRSLVAHAIEANHLADWRVFPDVEGAVRNAQNLRSLLGEPR